MREGFEDQFQALKRRFAKARDVQAKMRDEVKFIRSWVESPLRTGAISPSGPALAEKMASYLPVRPNARVVELGPGTGMVTKALYERGLSARTLKLIEFNPDFCTLLRRRYPGLDVIEGDAYALKSLMAACGWAEPAGRSGGLDGIVSSLPLLTRPEPVRLALLDEAMELLQPGAPFIQFSYGLSAPVRPRGNQVTVACSEWIWKNLPPARVWIYRRSI